MPSLQFKGKSLVENHHLSVPYRTFVPDVKKSFTKKVSLDDNLIIHGDNLEALKALLPSHAGRVKCIYIDPPYNTGEEGWAYNDNVNNSMIKDWLGKTVDKDDMTRHDKWLCMMMPRLTLLRELLADDGAIFISIDDNEQHHLRMLMNEIFREENFLGLLSRRTKIGGGSASHAFAIEHDYVLSFAKDIEDLDPLFVPHSPAYLKRYAEKDKVGPYFWDTFSRSSTGTTPYLITAPDGTKLKGSWFKAEDTFKTELARGDMRFLKKKNGSWSVQFKQRLSDGKKIRSLWENDFKSSQTDLEELGLIKIFDYPKPVSLIKELIESCTGDNDIILDSFAGSGTTAQAVLELNKDHKNRKFILIQLPEGVKKNSLAYKNGFKTVIEITLKRVERVVKKLKNGSFSYFDLGKAIDAEKMLKGKDLPSFMDLARYVFYTATGAEFVEKKVDQKSGFIGESKEYEAYLIYEPNLKKLKELALDLSFADGLGKSKKKRLVFAPVKFLDQEQLAERNIEFCQLPFEIYRKGA